MMLKLKRKLKVYLSKSNHSLIFFSWINNVNLIEAQAGPSYYPQAHYAHQYGPGPAGGPPSVLPPGAYAPMVAAVPISTMQPVPQVPLQPTQQQQQPSSGLSASNAAKSSSTSNVESSATTGGNDVSGSSNDAAAQTSSSATNVSSSSSSSGEAKSKFKLNPDAVEFNPSNLSIGEFSFLLKKKLN